MDPNIEMRAVLCQEIEKIMKTNENVCFLDADLAKAAGTLKLRSEFPGRAFDVGIAEQNMASVAAGLASYGFIPFICTFTPFATRRICDQIAVSIAYPGSNVKIVGIDPGVAAELNGGTHMSFEDMGVLRSIPDMVLFEPCDNIQLIKALPAITEYKGPVYIRTFRKACPDVFTEDYSFDLMRADVLMSGKDVSVFATGIMVAEAVRAGNILAREGIEAEIINVHTLKPIDAAAVSASIQKTGCAVTCENHNVIGGLNSAVCELTAGANPVPVEAVGVKDHFGEVGVMGYLTEKYGLTSDGIVRACRKAVSRK